MQKNKETAILPIFCKWSYGIKGDLNKLKLSKEIIYKKQSRESTLKLINQYSELYRKNATSFYLLNLIDEVFTLAHIDRVYKLLPQLFEEVHSSNLSKLDENGKPFIFVKQNNQIINKMNRTFFKTILNGKELNANELVHDGDCVVYTHTFEVYQNDDFAFFFSTDEFFEEHESEQGKWRTMETFLRELEFYIDIENGDNADIPENRLQPTKEQSEMILKICQEKFYKIEEI